MMGPTKEQQTIIDDSGNIVVTAIPGSGKTYTVVKKIEKIMENCPLHRGVIAISYTNKASDELKDRCKKGGLSTNASFFGTMDKFYISQIIIQFAKHVTGNNPDYKVKKIKDLPCEYQDLKGFSLTPSDEMVDLMISALNEGYIPLEIDGEIAYWVMKNVDGAGKYMQARYSHVFIDEYQDCGAVQHAVFLYLTSIGIKGIAVGDKDQAIYGYDKRFPRYLLSLISEPGFNHYELTKNNRCHESISNYSLALLGVNVPVCSDLRVFEVNVNGDERNIAACIDKYINRIKDKYKIKTNSEIAILCRTNPIAKLFYDELKTPAKLYTDTVLDSDNSDVARLFKKVLIGYFSEKIHAVDLAEEWFSSDYEPDKYRVALNVCDDIFKTDRGDLYSKVDLFVKLATLCLPGKNFDGTVDILREILIDNEQMEMFAPPNKDQINIMTLHKSKGLEFEAVFHMDLYEYVFTFPDSSPDDKQQEKNLHYVGLTRAKKVCYLMQGTRRYRNKRNDFYDAVPSSLIAIPQLQNLRVKVNWR